MDSGDMYFTGPMFDLVKPFPPSTERENPKSEIFGTPEEVNWSYIIGEQVTNTFLAAKSR